MVYVRNLFSEKKRKKVKAKTNTKPDKWTVHQKYI